MYRAYAAETAGGKLVEVGRELQPLGANDVEIDVMYCGICHSDVSMLDNSWGMSVYPIVAGHEVIGRVASVGAEVDDTLVGKNVGLGWHSDYCGHCKSCRSADENLCAEAQGTIVNRDGGFGDKVVASAASVVEIPEGMDLSKVGPLLCGGITVYNPLVQFDVKPTDKVGVIGIGGLGHIGLKFLNAWGCEVTAFTSSDSKREEALALGAHATINSSSAADLARAVGQFDFIISTVNVKLDWNAYIACLAPKGRLHFVGATTEPLDLAVFPLLMGQKSVSASPVGSPATIDQMLAFAVRHDIEPQVEMFPMSDINAAIQHLRDGKARYRVVLDNT
ncbi:MAG: NAD(P)-dependent alcohol dehydrogenase [Oleiphilaceae bacterium]|nr:NAD(P)-dependent alcohol dehydrogenase [Oleiphilaceae bacterium]